MNHQQRQFSSMIGPLLLEASDKGLRRVSLTNTLKKFPEQTKMSGRAEKILDAACRQLSEYFQGARTSFDLPLDLGGTDFQKQVWSELSRIPFGRTVSYADIARKIKNPKAVRAVGSANGKNPVCIIVPCHRVITSDGRIGGYAGGVSIKSKLLSLEGCSVKI